MSVRLLSLCPRLNLSVVWDAASWWVTDVLPQETDRQAWWNNSVLNGPGSLLAHLGASLHGGLFFFFSPCAVCLQRWLFDCVLWLWSTDKSLLVPAVMNWLLWAEKAGNPVIWWEVSSNSWTGVGCLSCFDLLDIASVFLYSDIAWATVIIPVQRLAA